MCSMGHRALSISSAYLACLHYKKISSLRVLFFSIGYTLFAILVPLVPRFSKSKKSDVVAMQFSLCYVLLKSLMV